MTLIHSVTGQVDSSELGVTLVHEHMRVRSESVYVQFPHLYDEEKEFAKAVEQVNRVKELGVKTICDPTVMELGRDIRFIERVARETGVQIIAATGIYSYHYIPPHFQNCNIDYMADLFVRDIEVGIQNTSIKAGFLKCATDAQGITRDVEKVIRAAARAHKRTGVPIMTHSHPKSGTGIKQLDILLEEGVDPKRVLIGHTGDTDNMEYILKVLDHGAFIGMDRYGINRECTIEDRNTTVIELAKQGYADRMFLSQDYCCTLDWYPEGTAEKMNPKWTMSFILEEIIPELKRYGVTEEQINVMMVDNARRWFEG
ncbi:phosphotriesterase-related protein [Paenibacillus sp. BSR1-1]|uniref:phosphotriesterase family protein n=1 Tax=Paenibacillus sp. BSR1-1 TaxID=3020845 RepID=UPI0025AEE690|nr:phosphotriesterase-related protein [Paenibacillus sp. BSR1-1]MDN3016104.1 phosphotriesterase-related protein [Paenibacillus sp. BSR1-1]